jgi:DNA repair exonuclease SbcCD ATPase subunit
LKITLERLSLHNFKVQREFTLNTAGRSVNIFGDNGTGKTTVADAFMWLLFDKNTQDRADFEIKTLQPDGAPLHGLDHSVEGAFSVNNESLTLKKVYREKWTKQRGSASKQFTGHEVDHFINGVPVKKGEYTDKVKELIREDIFKLLTNVRHFNESLHWEKRREMLLEICGDISDADILIANPGLAELNDILGTRTLEDYSKIVMARRTEINKELERIPVRIDELIRGRQSVDLKLTEAIPKRKELKDTISGLLSKQAEIQSGGAVGEQTAKLRELEAELLDQRNAMHRGAEEELRKIRQEISRVEDELSACNRVKTAMEISHAETKKDILKYIDLHGQAEKEYNDLRLSPLKDPEIDTTCPVCNQSLPAEQIEEATRKAKTIRNAERAATLEKLAEAVNGLADKIKMLQDNIQTIENSLADNDAVFSKLTVRVEELREQYAKTEPAGDIGGELLAKIETAKIAVEQARQNNSAAILEIKEQIRYNEVELEKVEAAINQENSNQQSKDREEELKKQERDLSTEYEELERHLYLIEEFVKAKVKMLNAKINDRFKFTEFKLFNELVNGGIEPTCITTYQGVPYNNLNNGARINVGVDVINTLSEHYEITAPIFIDQREAVTRLIDTGSQVVSLIVSEPDKELRVELL